MHLKDAVNGPLPLVIQDLKFPDLDTIVCTIPGEILEELCPVPLVIRTPPPPPPTRCQLFHELVKEQGFQSRLYYLLVHMYSAHIDNGEY